MNVMRIKKNESNEQQRFIAEAFEVIAFVAMRFPQCIEIIE